MITALFIMFPVPSHYNICFGFADSLRQKGYRVIFAGTPPLRIHVENQAFEFVELAYIQEIIITNWRVALGLFITSAVEKKIMKARYREFLLSVAAVQNLCEQVKPDELYIDEHLNFYYLLLKGDFPNCTLVNTKLPTHRVPGIPPLTCSLPFKNNMWYRIYACWLWQLYLLKRYIVSWQKRLVLLGIDERLFLKRIATNKGIDIDKHFISANLLYDGIRGMPTIHLVPRQMEYNWYKIQPNERFIYYSYQRKQEHDSTLFWTNLHPLLDRRKNAEIKLVYASLGTLSTSETKVTNHFLNQLIIAFESLPAMHLIIADKELYINKPQSLPTNVHLFDWVPQMDLLQHCDLMITHGGTNSILECVQAKVPMLSYPLNVKADHPGNTARMVANSWGRQGNLRRENQRNIRQKIVKLLNNSSSYITSKRVVISPINDW